jgi:hypothetical protein
MNIGDFRSITVLWDSHFSSPTLQLSGLLDGPLQKRDLKEVWQHAKMEGRDPQ